MHLSLAAIALLATRSAHAATPGAAPASASASPPAISALAPAAPATILAMDASSAPARLDRLIAAYALDDAGLRVLAADDPVLVHQLLDPGCRAALAYILKLPPAEIRRIRDGQAVVRDPGDWAGDEGTALVKLAETLGVPARRVLATHVHTEAAQLLRVDLETRKGIFRADLAYPPDLAPVDAVASVRAWLGIAAPPKRTPPTDPSFESASSFGLVWVVEGPKGAFATQDHARHALGASSAQVSPADGTARLSQSLDLRAGDQVLLGVQAYVEGGDARARLVFLDADGQPLPDIVEDRAAPTGQGWQPLRLSATVPIDATGARIDLVASGKPASFDDLRLVLEGTAPAPVNTWPAVTSGIVEVRADPERISDPAAAAARIDQALRSGAVRVSVPLTGTVTVLLFADDAHRRALSRPALGTLPARGPIDDPAHGTCVQTADTPWIAACPLRILLERAWGPPGNVVLGEGLPRALAGSGLDLDAAARPSLDTVPPPSRMGGHTASATEPERAIATSFAGWLLRTQGQAAVRAAWQAPDLATVRVAGKDMAALEAAWRAEVAR